MNNNQPNPLPTFTTLKGQRIALNVETYEVIRRRVVALDTFFPEMVSEDTYQEVITGTCVSEPMVTHMPMSQPVLGLNLPNPAAQQLVLKPVVVIVVLMDSDNRLVTLNVDSCTVLPPSPMGPVKTETMVTDTLGPVGSSDGAV